MRSDRIRIVPHDPSWPQDFWAQAQALADIIGEHLVAPIEHIGSTAVPGLSTKAIIDMLAVVEDVDAVRDLEPALAAALWVRDPEARDLQEDRLSFCYPTQQSRTHHLHVVLSRHPGWRGWIAFRDRLRRDPEARSEYAALKSDLAERFGDQQRCLRGARRDRSLRPKGQRAPGMAALLS